MKYRTIITCPEGCGLEFPSVEAYLAHLPRAKDVPGSGPCTQDDLALLNIRVVYQAVEQNGTGAKARA